MPPSPYRLLWLEIAERQYLDLSDATRALVDDHLTLLESNPAREVVPEVVEVEVAVPRLRSAEW